MFQWLLGVLAGDGDAGLRMLHAWLRASGKVLFLKGVIMPWRRHGGCCHRQIRGEREQGPWTKANGGKTTSSLAPAVQKHQLLEANAASQHSGDGPSI